jgi:hypothetical protein
VAPGIIVIDGTLCEYSRVLPGDRYSYGTGRLRRTATRTARTADTSTPKSPRRTRRRARPRASPPAPHTRCSLRAFCNAGGPGDITSVPGGKAAFWNSDEQSTYLMPCTGASGITISGACTSTSSSTIPATTAPTKARPPTRAPTRPLPVQHPHPPLRRLLPRLLWRPQAARPLERKRRQPAHRRSQPQALVPLAMTAQAGSVRRWAPRRNRVLCTGCAKSATKCDEDAATATVDLGKTSGSKAIGLAMGLTGTALDKYELRPISGCVHSID